MTDSDKRKLPDPLERQKRFPHAAPAFSFEPCALKESIKNGLVVVDTNVLVVPFATGKDSIEKIRNTYLTLTKENRLRIPAQVAREFVDSRAEKLKIIFQQLSRKRDIACSGSQYPLLEGMAEYKELLDLEKEIAAKIDAYRGLVGDILSIIKSWRWNDPVSAIYRELFTENVIVESDTEPEILLKDLKYRYDHKIPPGYKDAKNEHSGVGDLIIWQTILDIGSKEKRDLIFVTGEEKADWFYKSEKNLLYMRYELLDEYRRASGGKTLHIISFTELLKEFGASDVVLAEVRQEEVVAGFDQAANTSILGLSWVEDAVMTWLHQIYPSNTILRLSTYPDFLVMDVGGYEVIHLRLVTDFIYHLREAYFRVCTAQISNSYPISIIFVAESSLEATVFDIVATYRASKTDLGGRETPVEVFVGSVDSNNQFNPSYSTSISM